MVKSPEAGASPQIVPRRIPTSLSSQSAGSRPDGNSGATETFQEVLGKQPSHLEVLKEVEQIYEEMKDWANAFAARQRIARLDRGDHAHILAHHQAEMGKTHLEKGEVSKAKSCFKTAVSIDPRCVDAYLHLGDLHFAQQEYKQAMAAWKKVVGVSPHLTFLAYRRLEGAYSRMKNLKPVEEFLKETARLHSDPYTHMALALYLHNEKDAPGALRELQSALDLDPAFWEARKFMGEILLLQGMKEEKGVPPPWSVDLFHLPYSVSFHSKPDPFLFSQNFPVRLAWEDSFLPTKFPWKPGLPAVAAQPLPVGRHGRNCAQTARRPHG